MLGPSRVGGESICCTLSDAVCSSSLDKAPSYVERLTSWIRISSRFHMSTLQIAERE